MNYKSKEKTAAAEQFDEDQTWGTLNKEGKKNIIFFKKKIYWSNSHEVVSALSEPRDPQLSHNLTLKHINVTEENKAKNDSHNSGERNGSGPKP